LDTWDLWALEVIQELQDVSELQLLQKIIISLSGELKSYSCYNSTLKHYFNIIDCGDILTTDRYEYVDLKLLRKNIEHYMCYFNQWFQFYKFVKHDTVSKDIFQNIMRHYVPLRIKV
jgi:hypothetical protein